MSLFGLLSYLLSSATTTVAVYQKSAPNDKSLRVGTCVLPHVAAHPPQVHTAIRVQTEPSFLILIEALTLSGCTTLIEALTLSGRTTVIETVP